MSEWIKVSERKPEIYGENVLIWIPQPNVRAIGWFNGTGWFNPVDNVEYFPTHWQPLPTPPPRESSFEQWWGTLSPVDHDPVLRWVPETSHSIFRGHAKRIWDAAVAAAKRPDFVP